MRCQNVGSGRILLIVALGAIALLAGWTSTDRTSTARLPQGATHQETQMTFNEVGLLAERIGLENGEFFATTQQMMLESGQVLVLDTTWLDDGMVLHEGDLVVGGDIVHAGVIWNVSSQPATFFIVANGWMEEGFDIPPGQMLAIGPTMMSEDAMVTMNAMVAVSGTGGGGGGSGPGFQNGPCSVTCASGNFACCTQTASGPKCRCRPMNNNDNDCVAGGKGAPSCSLGLPPPAPSANPSAPSAAVD